MPLGTTHSRLNQQPTLRSFVLLSVNSADTNDIENQIAFWPFPGQEKCHEKLNKNAVHQPVQLTLCYNQSIFKTENN